MTTLNVRLTPKLAEFVGREVASGDYASASDVVDEALLLLQHERDVEREKLEILKREIALGLADADTGRFSTRTIEEMADAVLKGRED